MELEPFPLIIDQVEMKLMIAVPVERCLDCSFAWTDYRAEKIRDSVTKIYYLEV